MRIRANRIKYKQVDFVKWLVGEMITRKLTQRNIAEIIGATQQMVSRKISQSAFTYPEMLMIFEEFETDLKEQAKLLIVGWKDEKAKDET